MPLVKVIYGQWSLMLAGGLPEGSDDGSHFYMPSILNESIHCSLGIILWHT